MSELYRKSLLKLELDQVLELLSQCAGSTEGKAACLRLYPSSDLEDVQAMLDETTAASDLCTRNNFVSINGNWRIYRKCCISNGYFCGIRNGCVFRKVIS